MGNNIKSTIRLEKIEVNDQGDYIALNPSDSMFFDNFVNCFQKIINMSEETQKKIEEIENRYDDKKNFESKIGKISETSKLNVQFSEESILIIDELFGEGTVKKYFRHIYEEIPSFLPDTECFIDFFEQIIPVVENIFGKHIKEREKLRKSRMAKYVPQDHKKPGGRQ